MGYEVEWTVRAGDTDYSGLIYTPVVTDRMLRAMEAVSMDAGVPRRYFGGEGDVMAPAVNVEVDYLAPLRVDDEVTIEVTPAVGTTSVTFEQVGRTADGEAFRGHVTIVFVDREDFEPIPVPGEVRERLRPYAEGG